MEVILKAAYCTESQKFSVFPVLYLQVSTKNHLGKNVISLSLNVFVGIPNITLYVAILKRTLCVAVLRLKGTAVILSRIGGGL